MNEPITFVGTEHAQQRIEKLKELVGTDVALNRIQKLQERREAIWQGAAAVRMEGGRVSDFALGLLEDWARDEITMDQVFDALIAYYTPASSSESSESPHHS